MNVPVILRRRRFQYGGGVVPFSPSTLFASGEEGAWYEPSTTTAFRSTTDLTPCGYGQSAGFLLDLSKGAGYSGGSFTGLGSELVTNGTFDTDVSGWTAYRATLSFSSGRIRITGTGNFPRAYQAITTVVGKTYYVEGDSYFVSGTNNSVYIEKSDDPITPTNNVSFGINEAAGAKSGTFVATATTTYILLLTDTSTDVVEFDNISVRELPGNHATQGTESARPILARVPETGRRNLLERTEEFDDAAWVGVNATITANVSATTDPNGNNTAEKLVENADTAQFHQTRQTLSVTVGSTLTFSVYLKAAERSDATLLLRDGTSFEFAFCAFDLSTGTVGSTSTTGTGYSGVVGAISDEGDGWYRCSITASRASAYAAQVYIEINDGTTRQYNGDGTSGIYIWGAQLEAASSASAYQRVSSQYDITEAGVTSLEYLAFDGSDDKMLSAGAIDLSGATALSVFAGVRKLEDGAASDVIASALDTNTWSLRWPRGATTSTEPIFFTNTGALSLAVGLKTDAPETAVLTGLSDQTANTNILRRNGVQEGSNNTAQSGGYGNVQISSIGPAGGAEMHIYGIVFVDRTLTAQEISDTESYVANLSGVTLP